MTSGTGRRPARRPGRPIGGGHVVDREHVLDAAERVIRRDGSGASLDMIAREAGVTKPIVYARIGSRTDLANALAERLADRMIAAAADATGGRPYGRAMLASLIEANLLTVAEHRELFLYVTGGTSDESPKHKLYLAERSTMPMAQELARRRAEQGLDPRVADPWAYAVVGMLQFVSMWWLNDSDRSAEQLADQLAELLWSGLANV
jgi:AcrR family transcriptional regulator